MPGLDTNIWMALKTALSAVALNPAMVVIDPSATFTPPVDAVGPAPFVLVSDLRNDRVRWDIAGKVHVSSGTMILTICWPIARPWSLTTRDVPHAAFLEMASPLVAAFPADRRMRYSGVCVRVLRTPDLLPPELDGAYRQIRVRIPWEATQK